MSSPEWAPKQTRELSTALRPASAESILRQRQLQITRNLPLAIIPGRCSLQSKHKQQTLGSVHAWVFTRRMSGFERTKELVLRRELLLTVETVAEVDAADATVGMNLHAEGFDVVGAIGAAREVREVELDLVPALVEAHGHGTNEGLDASCGLVVGSTEAPCHALVVKHLDLKAEVLVEILNDHDEEGQLDAERLMGVIWRADVHCAHVGASHLEHTASDVAVCEAFDVAVPDLLVPELQGLAPNGVQDRQEARLRVHREPAQLAASTTDAAECCAHLKGVPEHRAPPALKCSSLGASSSCVSPGPPLPRCR